MQPEKQYEFSAVLSPELVREIGDDIHRVSPSFDAGGFYQVTAPHLEGKLVKERGQWIADRLRDYLPQDPAESIPLLTAALGPKLSEAANFGPAFKYLPHGSYVAQWGLEPPYFEAATHFLYEMTQRFSAEFAIRPYLMRYPKRMLPLLQQWAADDSQHVRRLVSEGTRPRLPWGLRVTAYDADYAPILTLLHQLHDDPELYVRRSVANHLNDLTKDRPDLVLDTLEQWQQKPSPELEWVIKHALRSLIKAGNARALALIGFRAEVAVRLEHLAVGQERLLLGEKQSIAFRLVSEADQAQEVLLDYVVYFKKANGELKPKVFKWKTFILAPRATITLERQHLFKPMSTRRLYAGKHRVSIQVNGQERGEASFELVFP